MKKLILIFSVLILISCEDSGTDPVSDRIDIQAIAADASAEFIYFEDGDLQFYYPKESFSPDFSNTYLNSNGSDQLNLMMLREGEEYEAYIFVQSSQLNTSSFPKTISGDLPSVELQLINTVDIQNPQFGANDDVNYVGSSHLNQMSITMTSFDDNVLSATFSGTIETKTGKSIDVENGLLRIKVRQ
ncbi:MAG: hypothetical protein Roseis2KO_29290 [Roseivirga sp.]